MGPAAYAAPIFPHFVVADFGVNSGWSIDRHLRIMSDVTGDGRTDVVAFGNDGVYVAVAAGDGTFR